MNKFYALICVLLPLIGFSQSDLVLTGVFDGPLPGGLPKGIELYATADIADLSTYGLGVANNGGGSDGKEYDFPADAVTSGSYIYITPDDALFQQFFGIASNYQDDIMNINGDDPIELYKDGAVIDVYGDVANDGTGEPWEYLDGWASRVPGTEPDGTTFEPTNWVYGGINVFDGQDSNASAEIPMLFQTYNVGFSEDQLIEASNTVFTPMDITVEVGALVKWKNIGGHHNVNGSKATYPDNPIGFMNGGASSDNWEFYFLFSTAGVYHYQCDPHVGVNMIGSITVEANVPSYTPNTIAQIETTNAEGILDSLNANVEITGIVHGIDFSAGNTSSFFVIDATAGISVLALDGIYDVNQGDEVKIQGVVSVGNSLSRIDVDNIVVLSQGNTLTTPTVVTVLDESTEGEIIRLNSVSVEDASTWLGDGNSFTTSVTDGTNSFDVRIDSDSDLASIPAPVGTFDLIGFGTQFDQDPPFTDGYQILPRFVEDIIYQGNPVPNASADEVLVPLNGMVSFDLLANDFVPGTIMSVTLQGTSTLGQATVSDQGVLDFPAFQDECGMETLSYILCTDNPVCDTADINITVECPISYPARMISEVNGIDAVSGIASSLGETCQLNGIVYGINLRPAGLQFTLIDKSDPDAGIGVFNFDQNLGYTVQEGDEITIDGTIDFFNGTTQIAPVEISLESSGNSLFDPAVVTALGEETESKLIRLSNCTINDPSQWNNNGGGFNVTVTDGAGTDFLMRIDGDVLDLVASAAPTEPFHLVGIGGQFDNSEPYLEGYQILPRGSQDILLVSNTNNVSAEEAGVLVFPNPTNDILNILTDKEFDEIVIFDLQGRKVKTFASFSNSITLNTFDNGTYVMMLVGKDLNVVSKITILK